MSQWAVTHQELNDRGNLAAGFFTVVVEQPSEAVARQVFADTVRAAESLTYADVQLRLNGEVVGSWPATTADEPQSH